MNEQYLNKLDAARYLGIATRTLEKYMKEERIPFVYGSGQTRSIALFLLSDLDSLKTERARPHYPQSSQIRVAQSKRRKREEMYAQLQSLQREVSRLREDFHFAVEALLEFGGLSAEQARLWRERNLGKGDS